MNCLWEIAIIGAIQLWFMLDWTVRNRTVWSLNWMYLKMFTNVFNVYVKTGLGF